MGSAITQYRVVSAPTGSGKSTYAWSLVAALVEADFSLVRRVPLRNNRSVRGTPPRSCRVSSDRRTWPSGPALTIGQKTSLRSSSTYGFRPCTRFHVNDLDRRRDLLVTHAFQKRRSRPQPRTYPGEHRTLTIEDERPKEVSIFDIDQGDVSKVRDWATLKFGNDSAAGGPPSRPFTDTWGTCGRWSVSPG